MSLFDFLEDADARLKAEEAHQAALNESVQTALKEKLDDAVNNAVSGLKKKNDELLSEKKKIAETLKNFENLDPEKAREALKFLEENENAKLLKEGKIEELLAKQTTQMREDHEAKMAEMAKKLEESNNNSHLYKTKYEQKMVEDSIRSAALKAGVRPEALEDVLTRGGNVFSLGEDGSVEARDKNGKLVKTADDMVLTTENWVEGLKKTAPHYWPGSEGAGGLGGEGGGGMDDLTAAMNDAAKKGDMVKYRKLREKHKKMLSQASA